MSSIDNEKRKPKSILTFKLLYLLFTSKKKTHSTSIVADDSTSYLSKNKPATLTAKKENKDVPLNQSSVLAIIIGVIMVVLAFVLYPSINNSVDKLYRVEHCGVVSAIDTFNEINNDSGCVMEVSPTMKNHPMGGLIVLFYSVIPVVILMSYLFMITVGLIGFGRGVSGSLAGDIAPPIMYLVASIIYISIFPTVMDIFRHESNPTQNITFLLLHMSVFAAVCSASTYLLFNYTQKLRNYGFIRF